MIYGSGTEQIKPYRKKCIIKLEKRKAPVYRRQAEDEPAGRLFFNLLDGLSEMWRRLLWDEGIRHTLQEGAFCLLQGVAYDSSPKEPELNRLLTSSRWRLELDNK
jgi:hypothetical protein